MAASSERGDEEAPDGAIAAMLANRNVHDRLYSGAGPQKPRVKEAREAKQEKPEKRMGAATEACLRLHQEGVEQKKELMQKAKEKQDEEFLEGHPFRPAVGKTPLFQPEKMKGTREEAWQRLQQSNSQKEIGLKQSREKLQDEFAEAHPFKPTLAEPKKIKFAPKPLPPTTQQEWIQMQKDWQQKKLEKRTEKLRMKREEEEKEIQENNVRRNVKEVDAAAACKRLHQQHARQQERQHKKRLEHFADAHEDLNRLHREVDKTPVASAKVDQMVERLYDKDREHRQERHQQRMKQKKTAERAEQLLLEALSVHSPPEIRNSYHHDEVSVRMAKELEQLREQVAELQQRALRTNYKELVKQSKAKAKPRSKSKEATPRQRTVSPSYSAQYAKAKGGPGAKAAMIAQSTTPSRSPAPKPAPRTTPTLKTTPRSPPRAATSRRQSPSPRPPVSSKAGSSPAKSPKSPSKEQKASPKARSKPATETADSFADQVRAANAERRNSGSSASEPRGPPAARRSRSSSRSSRSSRGQPLTPRRLRAPSGSSTGSRGQPVAKEPESAEPAEVEAAAVKIQSRVRGRQARQEAERRRRAFGTRTETKTLEALDPLDADVVSDVPQDWKASKASTCSRERKTSASDAQLMEAQAVSGDGSEVEQTDPAEKSRSDAERDLEDLAATKIQSRVRGKQARREVEKKRALQKAETRSLDGEATEDQELAAIKIQSRVRGNQARREVAKRRAPEAVNDEESSQSERAVDSSSDGEGQD